MFDNAQSLTQFGLKLVFFLGIGFVFYKGCEMQEIGCNPSVDNQSSACVPHPVEDDDDVLENWDDTNNSDDHLSSDDSDDEVFPWFPLVFITKCTCCALSIRSTDHA